MKTFSFTILSSYLYKDQQRGDKWMNLVAWLFSWGFFIPNRDNIVVKGQAFMRYLSLCGYREPSRVSRETYKSFQLPCRWFCGKKFPPDYYTATIRAQKGYIILVPTITVLSSGIINCVILFRIETKSCHDVSYIKNPDFFWSWKFTAIDRGKRAVSSFQICNLHKNTFSRIYV